MYIITSQCRRPIAGANPGLKGGGTGGGRAEIESSGACQLAVCGYVSRMPQVNLAIHLGYKLIVLLTKFNQWQVIINVMSILLVQII